MLGLKLTRVGKRGQWRPEQNGRRNFKLHFLGKNICAVISIGRMFVPGSPNINTTTAQLFDAYVRH